MKYMLMICDNESVILSPAEVHALPQIQAWDAEVDARGIRRGGARLRPSSDATTVRVRDGQVLVSDGPFAETIVDHVIEFRTWREDLARLLNDLDVFLVGVHCDLAEIDRRERSRGDRRIGEGRSHVEADLIHTFGPYDLEIDTTNTIPSVLAESVLAAWRARSSRRAL
jgi:chloramphenicol 3-O-phosphotransferase